jgi:hypothetical protein
MEMRTVHTLRRRELLLAALAVLSGCGGVDSGGTGSAPTFSSGAVSGLGSVILNGVRYDTLAASITDDEDRSLDEGAVTLGTQAEIIASEVFDDGVTQSATARSIRVVSQLIGRVESSDPALAQLRVLGQVVQITGDTYIDASIGGQAGLAIGDTVEVHASIDAAAGRYLATRIDRPVNPDRDKIVGLVSTSSTSARMVVVGGITIDWDGVVVDDAPRTLAPGRLVRATLALEPASGVRKALSLRSALPGLDDRERVEVEGRITAFVSASAFAVNGIPVDAMLATFPDGSNGLALGIKVEVAGSLRGGVLMASRVEIKGEGTQTVELEGRIQSVDSAAQRFVVRGVTVSWDVNTRFDSSSPAELVIGREVSVKGRLSADGTRVEATQVHVER